MLSLVQCTFFSDLGDDSRVCRSNIVSLPRRFSIRATAGGSGLVHFDGFARRVTADSTVEATARDATAPRQAEVTKWAGVLKAAHITVE